MSIDFNQLRELLAAIAGTDITEFNLKSEDFELQVRKGTNVLPLASSRVEAEGAAPPLTNLPPVNSVGDGNVVADAPSPSPVEKKWVEITSPMVGTFYRAPAPDEPAFVETSDRITTGQTVCIIEAMKLMNEIEAEVSGVVMEIMVENGTPVEYGQTLMWINPG